MKKNIFYLLAFIAIVFTACNPLKDAINDIEPVAFKKDLTLTLTTVYATVDAANIGIAKTLNSTYPQLGNGSKAFVTYNTLPPQVKPADSAAANVAYTVTDADYLAINKNSNKNFSAAKVLEFLTANYSTPVEKQLQSLNYVYYESGATTSAGVPAADSFLYLNGQWNKIYQVTPAQYTSLGKGSYFNFAMADEPSLNKFFNVFLKSDAVVAANAKVGDVKYVSFAFYNSSTRINSRRISTLIFDGSNWAYNSTPSKPLTFIKQDGKWIPDPTIYYTMVAADYTNLNLPNVTYTFGTAANRGNVAQYKSFNISATNGTQWTPDEIKSALIYTLNLKFPTAAVDPELRYTITYYAYSGTYAYVPRTFIKSATGFEEVTP